MTPLLAQSFAIAALVWGQPACGTPALAYDTELAPVVLGYADVGACTIELAPFRPLGYRSPASVCTTVVHEWGHLTGHAHSRDPDNVMFPEQLQPYWRCSDRWRARFAEAP